MKTFDIGTEVLVINGGGCYSTYTTFFKENGLEEFEPKYTDETSIPIYEEYTILAKGDHSWNSRKVLVLENSEGDVYLMDENDIDLEEVRKEN